MTATIRILVLIVLVASCAEQTRDAPRVNIVGDGAGNHHVAFALRLWGIVGFTLVDDDVERDECARRWYDEGDVECVITVEVEREDLDDEGLAFGGVTDIEGRHVTIDDDEWLDGHDLTGIAVHELGHVLLDTYEHLAGRGNVMSLQRVTVFPQSGDRALACRTIGVCD